MISMLLPRRPTSRVLVNGCVLPGLIEAEVTTNSHLCADRFDTRIALGAGGSYDAAFWASQVGVQIEILMSVDAVGFNSMITGVVDTAVIDPIGSTLRIAGRDLSAKLIEARTQTTFSNQTSSEIATTIAQRHGLNPNVTPTTTLVGRYYQSEHDRITLDQHSSTTTDWDLLASLARIEGFALSVIGMMLNFGPTMPSATLPHAITPADCINLSLERHLSLAGGIEVTVKSWNSYQRNAFVQSVQGTAQDGTGGGGDAPSRRYVYVYPNLTPTQALNFAQQKLTELSAHERTIEVLLPGELQLNAASTVALSGTNTAFDQMYQIESIERRMSSRGGFTQRIRAQATSAEQDPTSFQS
jgi:phage protein D